MPFRRATGSLGAVTTRRGQRAGTETMLGGLGAQSTSTIPRVLVPLEIRNQELGISGLMPAILD